MAQLRQDWQRFVALNTVILVIGPEDATAFCPYWHKERLPFIGLPDPEKGVLNLYGQEVDLFRLGRMPAQMLIDPQGLLRGVHYGRSMADIPTTRETLDQIAELRRA